MARVHLISELPLLPTITARSASTTNSSLSLTHEVDRAAASTGSVSHNRHSCDGRHIGFQAAHLACQSW